MYEYVFCFGGRDSPFTIIQSLLFSELQLGMVISELNLGTASVLTVTEKDDSPDLLSYIQIEVCYLSLVYWSCRVVWHIYDLADSMKYWAYTHLPCGFFLYCGSYLLAFFKIWLIFWVYLQKPSRQCEIVSSHLDLALELRDKIAI